LVGALAGVAGDAALVSVESNSVLSFIKPSLHVGEQIGGGSGCRASWGRGGIAAGFTTAGGELLAQALTSSASSTGSSQGGLGLFLGIGYHLGLFGLSALFLGPLGFAGLTGLLFGLGAVVRELGLDFRPAGPLHSSCSQGQQQGNP